MLVHNSNIPMLKGCGWVKEHGCGCAQKRLEWQYADTQLLCDQLLRDNVLNYPIKNFVRFDQASKIAILSVALAFHDAGILYTRTEKQDIGILGMSLDGAFVSNLNYFKDYVECGRKLGRGNLFIYTLPSSPLAEAAIHFGLQGPLVYTRSAEKSKERLLAQAEFMVKNGEIQSVLAVILDIKEAECYFISGK